MSTWLKADRPDPWPPAALTPADERASPETWLGLVRHMADVESWFHEFDGDPLPPFYWSPGARDNAFDGVDPERADQDLATSAILP